MEPITREETYLAKAAGQNVKTPEPITRVEHFLKNLIDHISQIGNGGGGGSGGSGSTESVQSDWNQNDPAASDYVKNRTHYEEGSGEEILPETELSFVSAHGYYMAATIVDPTKIVGGQLYTMLWDGIEYKSESFVMSSVLPDGVTTYEIPCIGNPKFGGKEDNGIPFYACNVFSGGLTDTFTVITDSTEETHTLSISYGSTTIKTIDEKFIPDTIARVENVTTMINEALGAIENGSY